MSEGRVLEFDEFFEKIKYSTATKEMCGKAKYKLANWLAHGYEIESTTQITILERGNQTLMLDNAGNIWKAEKAI